jgi:pimeloyl-ACP methyl ester carboxylesterase
MDNSSKHLPGIGQTRLRTNRLETHVLTSGPAAGEPVLFLHGNLSTSTYWEETMLRLPKRFRAVAPDLRGYGLSDQAARIDAMRGTGDWVDDAISLADTLGWDRFHLVAHSLGGCVAWRLLGGQSHRLHSATLFAPGPPCGFGGARGTEGQLNHPDGAGSGAGLVHPDLLRGLVAGERELQVDRVTPRLVLNRLYWKPPFRPAREEQLLTAMLQSHLGEKRLPGDKTHSPHWPGFAPGRYGPINALAPRYNQEVLAHLLDAPHKPSLLWIYGSDDGVISDCSSSDPGVQGQIGVLPGWPGREQFPPQPMLTQVKYALDQYQQRGGSVHHLILPGVGHTPYLENPEKVFPVLIAHLETPDT